MFRIKACYMILPNGVIEARAKSANFTKYFTVSPSHNVDINSLLSYKLLIKTKELVRDELFRKHGNDYKVIENKHYYYIRKSLISCLRRMKQVPIISRY